ncbi:MAG TPA: GAF domain-containing protein [Povalibacter sp.]|uniref:GAF domain-containing protein n=1 Tax=Povalibacter sp. TaxID=1962978 RepID=UPI002B90FE0A|nr:GAF domain-containing protein [Povalibacter sp.]HMN46085.1 GAF domain-containing protein [Povalibacter sp.]
MQYCLMTNTLLHDLETRLAQSDRAGAQDLDALRERLAFALERLGAHFGAPTGTIHRADAATRELRLLAYRGLPEVLVPITSRIPFGKGIAGLCAETVQNVTVCNLQTDDSGKAKPGARLTGVEGAIAVPIFGAEQQLLGVLGIGKIEAHTYSEEEQRLLEGAAEKIAPLVTRAQPL